MPKIIMLRGVQGSGKTCWAKEKAKTGNYMIVSKDAIREKLGGYTQKREKDVIKIRNQLIRTGIELGKNVIVDDTNLNPVHEKTIRQIAKEIGATFQINDSFMNVPIEECIARDLHRGDKAVGASVIWETYHRWVAPNSLKELEKQFDKPRCVLCDIDGTLARNTTNRSYYDWSKVGDDTPDPFVGCIIDALANYGIEPNGNRYPTIIYVSGREETARENTEKWLKDNGFDYGELLMREEGDKRPDDVVKEELYHKFVEPKYAVLGVIDDRSMCIRMWQRLGLRTANVGLFGVEF